MAIITFTFDIDAALKQSFVTDDSTNATNVQIIRKSDSAVLATISIAQQEAMVQNYNSWALARNNTKFVAYSKV